VQVNKQVTKMSYSSNVLQSYEWSVLTFTKAVILSLMNYWLWA